jgi:hypothetical protein
MVIDNIHMMWMADQSITMPLPPQLLAQIGLGELVEILSHCWASYHAIVQWLRL